MWAIAGCPSVEPKARRADTGTRTGFPHFRVAKSDDIVGWCCCQAASDLTSAEAANFLLGAARSVVKSSRRPHWCGRVAEDR